MYLIEARHVRKDFVTKRNIFGKPVRTVTPVLDVSLAIMSYCLKRHRNSDEMYK